MSALLDPAVLFFVLGVIAGLLRSDLQIPEPIAKFLSLYLLMALGLKGGFVLAESGLGAGAGWALVAALLLACVQPLVGQALLRRAVSPFDALAVAAAYGSVSAVTYLTAVQQLPLHGLEPSGTMTVAMVLMESPAIVIALMLARRERIARGLQAVEAGPVPGPRMLLEALVHGPHLLLIGALLVGWISGDAGRKVMQPFSVDLFKGMLSFFLLDMGLKVAQHARTALRQPPALLGYALVAPWVHAGLALGLAMLFGLSAADGALLMVLAASASYIVVPAVLRDSVPEAQPVTYLGLSLGITFPMNILLGVPVHLGVAHAVLG